MACNWTQPSELSLLYRVWPVAESVQSCESFLNELAIYALHLKEELIDCIVIIVR